MVITNKLGIAEQDLDHSYYFEGYQLFKSEDL